MKTVTLEIPENIDIDEIKMQLASKLFGKGIISSGQAAQIAGISKRAFIENVGNYGISIFGESLEDIKNLIDA